LLVNPEHLGAGVRHAVYLELRNDSLEPVAVVNAPRVEASLAETGGNPVSPSMFPMGGPIPNPQWAVIPREATLQLRIDSQTVAVPEKQDGLALMAVAGHSWSLRPGSYVLKLRVIFEHEVDAPPNQWTGVLSPLSIAVVVPEV
jgi:hypothetical protein